LVKSAETLCGGGYTDSQLKVVSIDYFFLMKNEFGMPYLLHAKGTKMGLAE